MAFICSIMSAIITICKPKDVREVRCIFRETVNMTEIQSKYKFISCSDDGVFTLQEKKNESESSN